MWINGETIRQQGRQTIDVIDPARETVIGQVVRGDQDDARAAVDAAHAAFGSWKRIDPAQRATALREIAENLQRHRAEFVELLVQEQGKPVVDGESEIDNAIELFHFYSGFAWRDRGAVNQSDAGFIDFVQRGPVGPIACIVPWNFPVMLMARKVAAALAGGNTVVVKPSEETPLTTLLFAEKAAAHLPTGVLNVVTGYGAEVGEALVRDPRIRHIAFTGSTATGKRLAGIAAEGMKGTTLELGGKDPLIVGPDVDLARIIPEVAFAALHNAGQCCTSTERIYVDRGLLPDFTDALVEHVRGYRLGAGSDAGIQMGPLITEAARRRIVDQVSEAQQAGARVLAGGVVPADLGRGWFYEPTVIVDVPDSAKLLREETFGPVLPVAAFGSVDEAIRQANDTIYGLGASILSNDPAFIKRCIDGLDVGNVFINDPLTATTVSSFGGTKMSGTGRELGVEGFEAFRESKHVHWNFGV